MGAEPATTTEHLVRPVPLADSGDRERDVDDTVRNYTKAIEDCVREYPEQYFWLHRRWKSQPKAKTTKARTAAPAMPRLPPTTRTVP